MSAAFMCIPTPFAAHGRYSQHPFLGNTLTSQRPHSNQSLSSSKAVVLKCCQETRKSESPKSGPEGPGSPSPCHGRSPALDVDIAAFSIPQTDGEPVSNEAIFQHGGISAYATFNSAFALVDHLPSRSAKDAFLASLRASESFNTSGAQYSGTSAGQQVSVDARLCDALQQAKAGVATSALLVEFSNSNSTIMRASWAGVVGLIVVRDGEIVFRTHETREARDGLENMLNVKIAEAGNQRDVSASPPLVPGLSSASCQGRSTIDSRMSTVVWGSDGQALDAHRPTCGIAMQSSFFELRDGDLILGGSQTFFANLSEMQILSFVRPVVDSYDATLAIANATCLGSFRTDDVEFVSYYLAHLALNFATSENAQQLLSFPFPPGSDGKPYVDGDLTVCAASVSFYR